MNISISHRTKNRQSIADKDLIQAYREGDDHAFKELVYRYKSRVYGVILLVTKHPEVAEDLLQETFIKVVDTLKSDRYKEKERFHYWIQRVAYNLAIDYFRKQKRTPVLLNESGYDVLEKVHAVSESVETRYVKQDTRRELHRLMRELPESQRKVIIMRHYLKMSFHDIAEEMNTSVNTALGRMRYGLINLRKKYLKKKLNYEKSKRTLPFAH